MKKIGMLYLLTACLLISTFAAAQTSDAAGATEAKTNSRVAPSISGSGTTNYIPLWTSSSALGNSVLYQSGGNLGVGMTSPAWALDVSGHINASKAYKIGGSSVLAFPGGTSGYNIGVGYNALAANTSGIQNAACGGNALASNTSGSSDTALGFDALTYNTTGSNNIAAGVLALAFNTIGSSNTAVGYSALGLNINGGGNTTVGANSLLSNTSGNNDTALGYGALEYNSTGNGNIAIGYNAALNVSGANSNNIHIGSLGSSADSGVIRIGTTGTQTSFFVAGVSGVTTGLSAVPVLVDTNGQLGTISSSRRFKTDIQDMGDASRDLMRLRPVTFRYKKPFSDGSQPLQYGLIAEEVAEVYPDLVAHSADGQIETVKYQLLDPMLLNEVQRQQAEIRELQQRLERMKAALAAMSGEVR